MTAMFTTEDKVTKSFDLSNFYLVTILNVQIMFSTNYISCICYKFSSSG